MSKIIKYLIPLVLAFLVVTLITVSVILSPKKETSILDNQGNPSETLLVLLDELNVKHDGTLKSIVEVTQKEWLRASGKERWDMQEKYQDKREVLFSYFKKLGLIDQIKPRSKKYDYALMLGATLPRVRDRLSYLANLWDDGVRFNKIIFLGGQRPLEDKFENKEKLLDTNNPYLPFASNWSLNGELPKTETEMMKFVFDQSNLPEEMKKLDIVFVDAPMKQKEDGSLKRPTTEDTILDWLKTNPRRGSCIAISNQPYVSYQDSILKTHLSKEFYLETVGKALDNNSDRMTMILDNLARYLYQEKYRIFQEQLGNNISQLDKNLRQIEQVGAFLRL